MQHVELCGLAGLGLWVATGGDRRTVRLFPELARRGASCEAFAFEELRIPRFRTGLVEAVLVVSGPEAELPSGLLENLREDPIARWASVVCVGWEEISRPRDGALAIDALVQRLREATWEHQRLFRQLAEGRRDTVHFELLGPLAILSAFASRTNGTRIFFEGTEGRARVDVLSGRMVSAIAWTSDGDTLNGTEALSAVAEWREGIAYARPATSTGTFRELEALDEVVSRALLRAAPLEEVATAIDSRFHGRECGAELPHGGDAPVAWDDFDQAGEEETSLHVRGSELIPMPGRIGKGGASAPESGVFRNQARAHEFDEPTRIERPRTGASEASSPRLRAAPPSPAVPTQSVPPRPSAVPAAAPLSEPPLSEPPPRRAKRRTGFWLSLVACVVLVAGIGSAVVLGPDGPWRALVAQLPPEWADELGFLGGASGEPEGAQPSETGSREGEQALGTAETKPAPSSTDDAVEGEPQESRAGEDANETPEAEKLALQDPNGTPDEEGGALEDPAVLVRRAEADLRRGDWREATASFERVLELAPSTPRALRGLARAKLAGGDAVEAVELGNRVIRSFPALTEDLVFLGDAYAELGQPDRARRLYRRALSYDPSLESARRGLAELDGALATSR